MANRTTPEATDSQRLLLDGMLGRLARWLRILGYDAAFEANADDWALVRRARAEDRRLLTRDRQLADRRGVSTLLIRSESLEEQVREVVSAVGLAADGAFSRCPVCNRALVALNREEARDRVPAHVYRTQTVFQLCPTCDRVYWRGSHWRRMKEMLAGWQDLTLVGDRGIMHDESS